MKYDQFQSVARTYANNFNSFSFEYRREVFDNLYMELKITNIVLVGLRQIGKTTLALQLMKKYLSEIDTNVNADDTVSAPTKDNFLYLNIKPLIDLDTTNLLTFISENKYDIVFIDEIQTIKGWTNWAQGLIDANPNTKFIFSGSNTSALTSEVMVNRAKVFMINPLSYIDFKCIWKDSSIMNYFMFGSYPQVKGYPTCDYQYMETVEQQIIDRIITEDFAVGKIDLFKQLMKKIANHIGNDLKTSAIEKDFIQENKKISRQTISEYLQVMNKSGLVNIVYKHGDTSAKRIGKVYLNDKSMIYKFRGFNPLNNNDFGALVENIVFNYLDSAFNKRFAETNVHSFRDITGKEIDFVVESEKLLIEVKHIDDMENQVDELTEHYNKVAGISFPGYKRMFITKGYKGNHNGWEFIPIEELLNGGIDVLRRD